MTSKAYKKKGSLSGITVNVVLFIIMIIMLYPVIYVVSLSISDPGAVSRGEVVLFPVDFCVDAYKYVLQDNRLGRAYFNTVLYAVLGTVSSIFFTGLFAYPLSIKSFCLKKFNTIMILITMYFGGGMIPTYMVIKNLHLIDTIWVMVIPGAISAYNVIIYRTFFSGIPTALRESAFMDGANDIIIFFKIILPLSKPLLATMALFSIVGIWNNYFSPLIYLSDIARQPLQLLLRQMVVQLDFQNQAAADLMVGLTINSRTIRAATILVTMLPIMCIYPFLQKYFASGIMIGSVKG